MIANVNRRMMNFHVSPKFLMIPIPVANAIGLTEAAIITIIDKDCRLNEEMESINFFKNGDWWTCFSLSDFANRYSFLGSESTIKRTIKKLEDSNYLISSNDFNSSIFDRTKWYRTNQIEVGKKILEYMETSTQDED